MQVFGEPYEIGVKEKTIIEVQNGVPDSQVTEAVQTKVSLFALGSQADFMRHSSLAKPSPIS